MGRVKNIFPASIRYVKTHFTREVAVYLALMLIAFIMRLWHLGDRAIHYDEGIHVTCGLNIFSNPAGWCLDPWVHGPFQFIGTGIVYSIFGQSEFTARLLPAIFGTAIVVLPFFLRRQLGRWGALAVAILLAFSPFFLYYSRYARDDIYFAFFTLLLVVCIWNYIADRRQRWLYIGVAALSLSFCALESTYMNLAIIALFLLLISGKELLLRIPKWFNLKELSPQAECVILLGTLVLPLFAAFIGYVINSKADLSAPWAISLVAVFFIVAAAIGLRWNPKRWLIAAAIFWGIFIMVWSVFFTRTSNEPGVSSLLRHLHGIANGLSTGLWGDANYWINQHGVARGGQPWFYYLMIIPIYEFLPLLFAFAGAIYYAVKGSLFSRFLVYWAVASFIIYSFYGEKMPWVSLSIVLPVIALGGMFIGFLFEGVKWKRTVQIAVRSGLAVVILVLFSCTAYVACKESYQVQDTPRQMIFYAGISADVPRIAAKIDELARTTGEGYNLSITVESSIYDSGWRWYLRDYTDVETPDLSSITSVPKGSVLILDAGHVPADSQYLEKYDAGERIKTLIWPPEDYKSGFKFGWWWNYFLHRDAGDYLKREAVVYFLKGE